MKKLGLAFLATAALALVASTGAEARGFGGFHGGGGFRGGFGGGGIGFRAARSGVGGAGFGRGLRRGGRGLAGFGTGALAGGLLGVAGAYADPWYGYGYDPAYSGYGYPYSYGCPAYDYSYGYPAYSYYGYGDPAEQVLVRRPRGFVYAHRPYRKHFASRRGVGAAHARFAPVHRAGIVHRRAAQHAALFSSRS